jgi:mannose-6-phosphate isomerase-like protein (cupin superfamily)
VAGTELKTARLLQHIYSSNSEVLTVRGKILTPWFALALVAATVQAQTGAQTGTGTGSGVGPLAQRIGHYDADKLVPRNAPYGGAGMIAFTRILADNALSTSLNYMERGLIYPHSSIGEHFHGHSEELHIIIGDSDPQYTINGRTAVVPAPSGVPVRMGSTHGVYNPSLDKPLEWIDINVGLTKGSDTYTLGESLETPPFLDKIAHFVNFRMDPGLLKPVANMNGGAGTVMYRRLLEPTVFLTPWSYVDEISVPSGATIGAVAEPDMSSVFYVLSGAGSVTVNNETVTIKEGDAVPVDLGQRHSFTQAGSAPLHLLTYGIARDMAAKEAFISKTRGASSRVLSGSALPAK